MKWIGIVCSVIGLITSGFMFYNEHKNKVSVSSTANNATRAVSADTNKTLDNLIYLKNKVEEVQNARKWGNYFLSILMDV